MAKKILIVGASARAAVFSALRAGYEPSAIDLFGDWDLRRKVPVHVVRLAEYPGAMALMAASLPPSPWLYLGGLENHPRFVEKLAKARPLWGISAASLKRIRDPFAVAAVLQKARLPCPEVRKSSPRDGVWLVKPRRGAGGLGIRVSRDAIAERGTSSALRCRVAANRVYFQQFVEGLPCSAAYLADAVGQCQLLGVTRQLIGEPWLNVGRFQYCGSVGPLPVPLETAATLARIGNVLTAEFALRGLFGVDFILQSDVPWPVEINPRYTASMEILEAATGQASLGQHLPVFANQDLQATAEGLACGFATAPPSATPPVAKPQASVVGKAILFASRDGIFPSHGPWYESAEFADVPMPGSPLVAGQPIFSFFASGATVEECIASLQNRAAELKNRIDS